MNKTDTNRFIKELRADTDLCVKCGLCLPHCPTYLLTHHEADSPRGRIALMEALANDRLKPLRSMHSHINRCLSCRACEAACPAQVPYGLMIDKTRVLLRQQSSTVRGSNISSKIASRILAGPKWIIRLLTVFVRFYQHSLLRKMVRKTGILHIFRMAQLENVLPFRRYQPVSTPHNPQPPSVHLFTGCTGELLDSETLNSAIRLLEALGETVSVPASQGCCGAVSLHAGDHKGCTQTMRKNLDAFAHDQLPIVYIATGCGAVLEEYKDLFTESDPPQDPGKFSSRCIEICDFIASHQRYSTLNMAYLDQHVAVHTPCSLRNMIKRESSLMKALQLIPGIRTTPLKTNSICCGAAGTFMLDQPEMSRQLRNIKIDDICEIAPDLVLSSNIGCQLHIQAGLSESRSSLQVIHPVTLLARQLRSE